MKIAAFLFVATALAGRAFAGDDCTPTIMANFPRDLAQNSGHLCTSIAVRLEGSERPAYTVAAFGDGTAAAVRVFDSETQVVGAATDAEAYGVTPLLTEVDVDGDGRPDVLLQMRAAQGHLRSWLLRWNGQTLSNVTPVDAQGDTLIGDAEFFDLDGDGKLELVEGTRDGGADVYHLTDHGTYASPHRVAFLDSFARHSAKPLVHSSTFNVPVNDTTVHHMTIINGTRDGQHRASSASIALNDEPVLKQNDVNQHVGRITRDVSLVPGDNTIRVNVDGDPGARIQVVID